MNGPPLTPHPRLEIRCSYSSSDLIAARQTLRLALPRPDTPRGLHSRAPDKPPGVWNGGSKHKCKGSRLKRAAPGPGQNEIANESRVSAYAKACQNAAHPAHSSNKRGRPVVESAASMSVPSPLDILPMFPRGFVVVGCWWSEVGNQARHLRCGLC